MRSCAFWLTYQAFRRCFGTRYGVLCNMNRHGHTLTSLLDGWFCEYGSSVELFYSIFEPPTAHGYPEDDHLRGVRLKVMKDMIELASPLAYQQ